MADKKIHTYRVDAYLEPHNKRFVEAVSKVEKESKSSIINIAVTELKKNYTEVELKQLFIRAKLQE